MAPALAETTIVNQANADYLHSQVPLRIFSNEVVALIGPLPKNGGTPTLKFFSDDTFKKEGVTASVGDMTYLEAVALACDIDANHQSLQITVSSALTGDREIVVAHEATAGSGVFRTTQGLPTRSMWVTSASPDDSVLSTRSKDTLTATVEGCGSGTAQDSLLVDPSGIVFDSQTDLPIADAKVTLIDVTGEGNGGRPGSPAKVFAFDGITPAPSTVTTAADGRYEFPMVAGSSHRVIVVPPGDYSFPSKLLASDQTIAQQLQTSRMINPAGSFGQSFPTNVKVGAVTFDVPLDANPNGLFVEKKASRSTAGIAETIEYSVTVQNVSGLALSGVSLRDDLPAGFGYVAGSSRIDGAKVADPKGGKGPTLTYDLPAMLGDANVTLTYRALIGPGALQGDGTNRAQAFAVAPARKQSNVASVTVQVDAGVFSDESFILGKVFADCNENKLQDAGEPGVPGVRFYLEDGSFVISDGLGKFSLYGVKPRTHVLKADRSTLPAGAEMEALGQRSGGDGGSRFVDSKPGELHRADFAIRGCAASLRETIEARRAEVGATADEMTSGLKQELKVEETPIGDVRALPASGIVGAVNGAAGASGDAASSTSTGDATGNAAVNGTALGGGDAQTANPSGGVNNAAPVRKEGIAAVASAAGTSGTSGTSGTKSIPQSLEALLPTLAPTLDFIGLTEGDALPRAQTNIRTKARAGTITELAVNGQPVPDTRIGKRLSSADTQVEAREYIGIDLLPGENTLTLTARDGFGNVRGSKTILVLAPGDLDRIVIKAASEPIPADGTSRMRARVQLEDRRGLIVTTRTPITLNSSDGQWQVTDLDPMLPGVQTMLEGGVADYELRAPGTPGTVELTANVGKIEGTASIDFAPQLRPMVAAGVIEGAFGMRKLDPTKLQPARADDGFEQELTSLGDSNNGKNTAGARAALFLKGKVKGDYLLTMGYDSDKDGRERLFRDIQPDKFYPVYGDSSVKGYDAQSTGHLYVRVDKNKSYLLAGDLSTQSISQARTLGAYNRSLSGVKEHYSHDGQVVEVFASRSAQRQIVQEIPANGTSGPYEIRGGTFVENSERVQIVTRDRNQPSIVLDTTTLSRFSDYEIERFTGQVLLRAPVASLDKDLNPRFIRVTYEVDEGGPEYWVTGADSQLKLTDVLGVGFAVVDDRNPAEAIKLASSNATLKLGDDTTVLAEAARSDRDAVGTGWGRRVELQHSGGALRARAFAGRTDDTFNNPSAFLGSGRTEAGAKASFSLNSRTNLVGEALYTEDNTNSERRDGGLLGVERSFAGNRKVEVGARHVRANPATPTAEPTEITSLRTKVASPLPRWKDVTAFAEYEQDMKDFDRRMAAIGGEYTLANRSRLYMRHELITSLSGPYALDTTQRRNTTVFGLDTRYMQDDRVFSEYRLGNALGERESEAAVGLRNYWTLARGIRASTSLERVDVLSGPRTAETAAVTGALEYTRNPLWKGSARLELRNSETSDGLLSTFGVARKISDEWTLLAKNIYAVTHFTTQPDRTQERFQIGTAFRDAATNYANGLARYEFRYEDNAQETATLRAVHVFSGHLNVQMRQDLIVSAQYAAKYVAESADTNDMNNSAQMVGFRATHDIGKRWDAGLTARSLFSDRGHTRQDSVGAEVGYMAARNLWLSMGYNFMGFNDRDLSVGEYTNRGTYMRLRFKLDESVFDTSVLEQKAGE